MGLLILTVFGACKSSDTSPEVEIICLTGEFRQFNTHCLGWVDNRTTYLYDIKINGHPEYDSITVVDQDLSEEFRIRGQKIYFTIDSVGQSGGCNFLVGELPPPYRISNVSAVPCSMQSL